MTKQTLEKPNLYILKWDVFCSAGIDDEELLAVIDSCLLAWQVLGFKVETSLWRKGITIVFLFSTIFPLSSKIPLHPFNPSTLNSKS